MDSSARYVPVAYEARAVYTNPDRVPTLYGSATPVWLRLPARLVQSPGDAEGIDQSTVVADVEK